MLAWEFSLLCSLFINQLKLQICFDKFTWNNLLGAVSGEYNGDLCPEHG